MAFSWNHCRFCGKLGGTDQLIKYGVRHYAHPACYLDAGKPLADLHKWQLKALPYHVLVERGLVAEVEKLLA